MGKLGEARPRVAALYERIIDLKSEHYVGSAAALAHVRTEFAAEALRNQLSHKLRLSPQPSVRSVIQLCDRIFHITEHLVYMRALEEELVCSIRITPLSDSFPPWLRPQRDYSEPFSIQVDYRRVMTKFFTHRHRGRLPEGQLLFVIVSRLAENERLFSGLLPQRIAHKCNLRQLLEICRPDEDSDPETKETALAAAKATLRDLMNSPLAVPHGSVLFAFDDYQNLYRRAERERTLKYLDVEREIARAYLHHLAEKHECPPEELISHAMALSKRLFESSRSRLEKMKTSKAPQCVRRSEERFAARTRYTYLAISKNLNWLLSRCRDPNSH